MYKPATKRVVLTCDVEWHGFDGSNSANNPTFFEFIEGTVQKTTIRDNARNKKENDNKLDLREKEFPSPVHEYTFYEIEDGDNLGENKNKSKHRMKM